MSASLLLGFLLIVFPANSQHRFDCAENHCNQKGSECPELNCEGGRILTNATACGCCDICLRNLKQEEDCITKYYGWTDNIAECGPGLFCQQTEGIKGKCVPTECLKKKKEIGEKLRLSFDCDHFGNLEAVVCLDDVLCFCVDRNGMRIFGTDIAANNDTMKCDCSRDVQDFPREVNAEDTPRCLASGNYDALQCAGGKCFCMDATHYEEEEVENVSNIVNLPCYRSERHDNERTTPCFKERKEQMKGFEEENLTIIGVDLVQCELDGTYSPLQCKGRRCSCVSRTGEVHNSYDAVGKEDGKRTCRCLRDKELAQENKNGKTLSVEDYGKIKCDGNYALYKDILSAANHWT